MENLTEKLINFEGGEILGIKDADGVLWLGVRKTMRDIGLSDGQARRQVENLNNDLVLNQGVANLHLLTNGGKQETLCIKEDFVTLWLAKISLTPKMQKENSKAVEKLIAYQLKCAKVLHQAFFETEEQKQQFADDLGLQGKIVQLEEKVDSQTKVLNITTDRLNTLIDNSTINSRQASKLLVCAKDRINTLLGVANSKEYKKNSRKYFKNLWLNLGEKFSVNTYKDLNPLDYSSAVTYITGWSFM